MAIASEYKARVGRRTAKGQSRKGVAPMTLLGILLGLAAYIALFRSTSMGYGYPQFQDQMGEADYGMLAVLNYCLAALGLAYVVLDGAFVVRRLFAAPAVLIGCALLVPTFVASDDPLYSLRAFLTMAVVTLPAIAYAARFGVDRWFELLRRFCIAVVFINVVYVLAFPQYAIMGGGQGLRGMFPHKNIFGPFMAIACIMLLPNFGRWKIDTYLASAALLIAVAFVGFSKSASAWVMLAAAPPIYLAPKMVLLVRHRISRVVMVSVFAVLLVAAVLFTYFFLFDTILEMLGRNATLSNRTRMWWVLFGVAADDPLFGHGFAVFSHPPTFMQYWSAFGWNAESTHNSYLEMLLNIGYVGLSYWLGLFVIGAWKNLVIHEGRSRTVVKQQIILIMVLISAFSQANHFFAPSFFWLTLVSSLFARNNADAAAASRPPDAGSTASLVPGVD